MELFLKGHNYRYELEQTLISLFPDKRPVIAEHIPRGGDFAICSLSYGSRFITARVSIMMDGAGSVKALRAPNLPADELERKRRDRQLLKRAFYLAALGVRGASYPWGSLTGIRPAKVATKLLEDGRGEKAAKRVLSGYYYISEEKIPLLMSAARCGLEYKRARTPRDVSIYAGIPFCPTRCAYCSFVSSATERDARLIEPYLDALHAELEAAGAVARSLGLNVKSVYIGGGTPTVLTPAQLHLLVGRIVGEFGAEGVELTVEAGRPDTIDTEKLAAIKNAGATRISVNPQSMSDECLRLIGRRHTAADTETAMTLTRRAGFSDINMDLIAGLPGDDGTELIRSVEACIKMEPSNITIHTLSYKKGSDLSGGLPGSSVKLAASLNDSYSLLSESGFEPYYIYRQKFTAGGLENTGWCQKSHEGQYNIYIMEELHSIISLGAGGVTKLVDQKRDFISRLFNPKYPLEYINALGRIISEKEAALRHLYG